MCQRQSKCSIIARRIGASLPAVTFAFLVSIGLIGCSSTSESRYRITVDDSIDQSLPILSEKKYIVIYEDRDTAEFVKPHGEQLAAAFAKLGYEPGTVWDSNIIVNVSLEMDEVITRRLRVTLRDLLGATNLDSIRYRNLANGRRSQLGGSPNSVGSTLLTANEREPGKTVITGAQLNGAGEYELTEFDGELSDVDEELLPAELEELSAIGIEDLGRNIESEAPNTLPLDYFISSLVLNVFESADFSDEESFDLKWQLYVRSDIPQDRKRPTADVLVGAAAKHLEKRYSRIAGL